MGLFHFEKIIIGTLKKKHADHLDTVSDLLSAMCQCVPKDYDKLLTALKEDGTLNGTCLDSWEVAELKSTKVFCKQCSKYLHKSMLPMATMVQNLDDWFCPYKVTTTDVECPARGRVCPIHGVPLFTSETKVAVENCRDKAQYLTDLLPLEEMYDCILPNPNSKHQPKEHLSKRGESKLESVNDRMSNFVNTGMRADLADSLNLMGTARFNLAIRHKRAFIGIGATTTPDTDTRLAQRRQIPAGWEKVLPFFNHSELQCVNKLAQAVSLASPFPSAEVLQNDTGERFFSQHVSTIKPTSGACNKHGLCSCRECTMTMKAPRAEIVATSTSVIAQAQQKPPVIADLNSNSHQARPPSAQARHANSYDSRLLISDDQPQMLPAGASVPIQMTPVAFQANQTLWMPPFAPAFCQQPFCSYQHHACCSKHGTWMTRRVGRPPHDAHCETRRLQLLHQQPGKERKKLGNNGFNAI